MQHSATEFEGPYGFKITLQLSDKSDPHFKETRKLFRCNDCTNTTWLMDVPDEGIPRKGTLNA